MAAQVRGGWEMLVWYLVSAVHGNPARGSFPRTRAAHRGSVSWSLLILLELEMPCATVVCIFIWRKNPDEPQTKTENLKNQPLLPTRFCFTDEDMKAPKRTKTGLSKVTLATPHMLSGYYLWGSCRHRFFRT